MEYFVTPLYNTVYSIMLSSITFTHMILPILRTIRYSMEFDQVYKESCRFSALTTELVDLMIVHRYQLEATDYGCVLIQGIL